MTLIITQISKHGIIHASDSNLSDANGKTVGTGQKCFSIPHLNAGLTLAGSFDVGTQRMDKWMNDFIKNTKSTTLESFAEELRSTLQSSMTKEQKSGGSLIHIAGYEKNGGKSHPEFWFVRNVFNMDSQTGEYSDFRDEFIKSEDFWGRDNLTGNWFYQFQFYNDLYQLYINGFTPGRIGYNIVQNQLANFYRSLWSNKSWKFRPPNNIDEAKLLVENYFRLIKTVFLISDYPGQLIGGNIQIEMNKQPDSIEI